MDVKTILFGPTTELSYQVAEAFLVCYVQVILVAKEHNTSLRDDDGQIPDLFFRIWCV
jgi:hypothetical protein